MTTSNLEAATLAELGSKLSDVHWRLSNLYKIQNKDGEEVTFKPNTAQRDFINNCGRSDLILKSRQLGFTTLCSIIGLDEAIFYDNWKVGIIAHTRDDANKIFASKVKFPYDKLPAAIRRYRTAKNDRTGFLSFDHGSEIGVSVSARSGTLQRLHVSEFGKICAKYPDKAREIVTGSFPAVGKNPKTLESTAEGQEGYFYQYAMDALSNKGQFGMHFYPWWGSEDNTSTDASIIITDEHTKYFDKLEGEIKQKLSLAQRRWWIGEEYLLGGDMKREHPATPQEAFEQAIEGAYFAAQFAHSEKHEKIGRFPIDPGYPVHSFWDLGRNDFTSIFMMQWIDGRARFVGYYENSGEHISHYFNYLKDWARQKGVDLGDVYWPHDGKREDLFLENGRMGVAEELGYTPIIVSRAANKMEAIDQARKMFPNCDFDEVGCSQGIKRLKHYRKDWDDTREVWKDRPRHDDNSHGADAFMTFSSGWVPPTKPRTTKFKPKRVA